jgi:hypothetical protein
MKNFVKISIIFVLILFALLFLVNYCYTKILLSKTILERTENDFLSNLNNIEILTLGDSHPQNGFSPEIVQNSFNFSSGGENYIHTYYKFKYYIKDFNKLNTIILPFDMHSFSQYNVDRFINEWYWRKYIDIREWTELVGDGSYFKKTITSWFPVIGNGGDFLNHILNKPILAEMYRGQVIEHGNYVFNDTKIKDAKDRVYFMLRDNNLSIEVLWVFFDKIIQLANEKGYRVLLVKYPVSEEYYNEARAYFPELEKNNKRMISVVEKNKNLKILDYQTLFLDKPQYFYNIDHLNIEGSRELTKK